jgi:hypothetical protein
MSLRAVTGLAEKLKVQGVAVSTFRKWKNVIDVKVGCSFADNALSIGSAYERCDVISCESMRSVLPKTVQTVDQGFRPRMRFVESLLGLFRRGQFLGRVLGRITAARLTGEHSRTFYVLFVPAFVPNRGFLRMFATLFRAVDQNTLFAMPGLRVALGDVPVLAWLAREVHEFAALAGDILQRLGARLSPRWTPACHAVFVAYNAAARECGSLGDVTIAARLAGKVTRFSRRFGGLMLRDRWRHLFLDMQGCRNLNASNGHCLGEA